jgi:hypothetical protein
VTPAAGERERALFSFLVALGAMGTAVAAGFVLFVRLRNHLDLIVSIRERDVRVAPWLVLLGHEQSLAVGLLAAGTAPIFLMMALVWFRRPIVRLGHDLRVNSDDATARTEMHEEWRMARESAREPTWRFLGFACMLGLIATVPVVFAATRIVEVAVLRTQFRTLGPEGYVTPVVVLIAVAVAFATEFARLVVRNAAGDLTLRIVAEALQGLVRVLVAIGVVLTAVEAAHIGQLGPAEASVVGMVTGLVGDRIVRLVFEMAATVFGGIQHEPDDGIDIVQGIGHAEVERLRSEGITSLQGLAYTSIAKLYFSTPFELERLCDWQDQALLLLRVDPEHPDSFRELPARVASELVALDGVQERRVDQVRHDPRMKQVQRWKSAVVIPGANDSRADETAAGKPAEREVGTAQDKPPAGETAADEPPPGETAADKSPAGKTAEDTPVGAAADKPPVDETSPAGHAPTGKGSTGQD